MHYSSFDVAASKLNESPGMKMHNARQMTNLQCSFSNTNFLITSSPSNYGTNAPHLSLLS